jgi:Cu+-exporting ATPase
LVGLEVIRGDENRILQYAASLETQSEHPLGSAVVAAAKKRGLQPLSVERFEAVPGKGAVGWIDGKRIAIGNRALLGDDTDVALLDLAAAKMRDRGETAILVAIDGAAVAAIGITDPVRSTAAATIAELRREGIAVVMLTGDSRATANAVAASVGIADIRAEVSPGDKVGVVRQLQGQGKIVAMAGDGINDAPALAQAQVGIAMGTGTDVAIESAGVTLLRGDLGGILRARRLSRATMRNIRQNLWFAFLCNALGIPIAAGLLYPFFGLLLSPMIASVAMSLSSVSVIGNALRLRRVRL